jgi:hypothetical protein
MHQLVGGRGYAVRGSCIFTYARVLLAVSLFSSHKAEAFLHSFYAQGKRHPLAATCRKHDFSQQNPLALRMMGQGHGYVIVPEKKDTVTSKPAGWTLWDQRSKGVTVVIGNAKQRRLASAREGKLFGPLAVPDMAKLQHKLKEMQEEKRKLHAEVGCGFSNFDRI